jgi:hypothetical protein
MKNSTLFKLIILITIVGYLIYTYTQIVLIELCIIIGISTIIYLLFSMMDYNSEHLIKKQYNIFYHIGGIFTWLDKQPKIIKFNRKNWRTPNDWDDEV